MSRAVVMAGGRGVRLRPYTTVLPKPLLPVGDRPILAILLEQLAAAGVTHIDLCVGYLGELIRAYLADSPPALDGVTLAIHAEREPLGTAGALRSIPDLDAPFLAINGDVLTSLDYAALLDAHTAGDSALTIVSRERVTAIGSGVLELDGDAVRAYTEKPELRHTVSLGIYAIDPSALAHLPAGRVDIPAFVEELIRVGRPVRAHPFAGEWFDVGTLADHEAATAALEAHPERF